jgi:hypothetical protein
MENNSFNFKSPATKVYSVKLDLEKIPKKSKSYEDIENEKDSYKEMLKQLIETTSPEEHLKRLAKAEELLNKRS